MHVDDLGRLGQCSGGWGREPESHRQYDHHKSQKRLHTDAAEHAGTLAGNPIATAAGLADRDLVVQTCGAVAPHETEDMGFTTAVLNGVDPLFTLTTGDEYGYIDPEAWAAYRALIVQIGVAGPAAAGTEVFNADVAAWNAD